MKKYFYLIALLYSSVLAAQQVTELKLYRNNGMYYFQNTTDTIAIVKQLPYDSKFFNGKFELVSTKNELTFNKKNQETNLLLNYEKRTFTYHNISYHYVIDYLQNNLILLSGSKVILEVEGRNLTKGIAIHYYDSKPDLTLAYLTFMIKRDAKTKFIMRHSVYKVGAFASVVFSVYSLLYLVK